MYQTITVVSLTWVDSFVDYGWNKPCDSGPSVIDSVGLLVREDKKYIVISSSYSRGGRYADQLTIPKCAILKMRRMANRQ